MEGGIPSAEEKLYVEWNEWVEGNEKEKWLDSGGDGN